MTIACSEEETMDRRSCRSKKASFTKVIERGIEQKIIKDVNQHSLTAFLFQPISHLVNPHKCNGFVVYNNLHMFGNKQEAKFMYAIRMSGIISGIPSFASQCVQCGECLEKCPHEIEIPDFLESVVEELEDADLDKRVAMAKKMLNME
jgi:predicted aldo/keto reductase-like oxidoreductase